ncbi:MAG TPA: hypothetical protein VF316_01295 [Polyangiaceae bacterium]
MWPKLLLVVLAACGGSVATAAPSGDGGGADVYGLMRQDGSVTDDAGARITAHGGRVLGAMTVSVIYVGDAGVDGAPSFDGFIDWALASSYWATLAQYGAGPGTRVASVRVPRAVLLPDGSVNAQGLIEQAALADLLTTLLHPSTGTSPVPPAQGYLLFLPDGVNVILGQHGSYIWKTCWDADAFHSTASGDPYVVVPPCAAGRRTVAISHELSEMATDPDAYQSWYSDEDRYPSGGEVADLCEDLTDTAGGYDVAPLWSEGARRCVP